MVPFVSYNTSTYRRCFLNETKAFERAPMFTLRRLMLCQVDLFDVLQHARHKNVYLLNYSYVITYDLIIHSCVRVFFFSVTHLNN